MKKLLTLFFLFPLTVMAWTGQVVQSFNTPGKYPSGITFDGQHLWVADFRTDKIYEMNKKGEVLRSIPSPAYWPMGLAFDGKYLWCADAKGMIPQGDEYHNGRIFKIDPKDGTILKTVFAPTSAPLGLTWDGKYLWCVDDIHNRLIQFDPEDGTTIRSFPSPDLHPKGVTFDGKYLWVTDRMKNEIYMIDPQRGSVVLITKTPGEASADITWDGKHLWNVDFQDMKIYELKALDDQEYIRYNPYKAEIKYYFNVDNFGPGNIQKMDVYFALPENRPNQQITGKFRYTPAIENVVTDQWGQKTAHFVIKNLKPGQQRQMTCHFTVNTWEVRYFIDPDRVGTEKEIPEAVKNKYLQDNTKFQIHNPIITDAVKKAVGNDQSLYWKMRDIYNYVIKHMYYLRTGGWNEAPTVLARGNGSCSEYSFVFISMCRSAGIPARYVGSIVKRGHKRAIDDVFHRWIEVYLPHYGWVPVDPTHGDRKLPRDQANGIGYLPNSAIVTTQGGGGSTTMGWTYNFNARYSSDAKTNVAVDYYGEWQ